MPFSTALDGDKMYVCQLPCNKQTDAVADGVSVLP